MKIEKSLLVDPKQTVLNKLNEQDSRSWAIVRGFNLAAGTNMRDALPDKCYLQTIEREALHLQNKDPISCLHRTSGGRARPARQILHWRSYEALHAAMR